jgi:hypothetical protein
MPRVLIFASLLVFHAGGGRRTTAEWKALAPGMEIARFPSWCWQKDGVPGDLATIVDNVTYRQLV